MYAIYEGNLEATKLLVGSGANYRLKTETGSPLIMAIESNSVAMLDYLLSQKDCLSLTETDLTGLTPMYVACYNSKSDIIRYLLEREEWAELLRSRGPFKATAFHALADQDFSEIAELIVKTVKDRPSGLEILTEMLTS